MKKRNLNKLQLKKKCISKLYGGSANAAGDIPYQDTGVDTIYYPPHSQGAEPGCVWYSELYSACDCHSYPHSNCMECPVEHNTNGDTAHHAAR